MNISEIQIYLKPGARTRLRAICSIVVDNAFVIHDLRIIEGSEGPFVAMPSRRKTYLCDKCKRSNHGMANYCNDCGEELDLHLEDIRYQYVDVAHPISVTCREQVERMVLVEYKKKQAEMRNTVPSRNGIVKTIIPNKTFGLGILEPDEEPEAIFDTDDDYEAKAEARGLL
jgi:DNA-binding cell septation regulator SpoVG